MSRSAERLRINEIFHSIQGEGTRAGQPCVFIRLTGCHLRCSYCDTEYAFYEGNWRTLSEILEEVRSYGCPFVEITGGEPLLQPAVYPLMTALVADYPTVALETSGAMTIRDVDPRIVRIVDLKTPSSGEVDRNCWENLDLLTPDDEIKFVIGDRTDYDWARDVIERHDLSKRCTVLLSPVCGRVEPGTIPVAQGHLDPQWLAEWMLADRLEARLSLQIHKMIWSPETRGV